MQAINIQEEALCHESNLYPILLAFDDTYYAWNRQRLNRALYLDRAIYTPDVVFEKDDVPLSLNNRIMEERIAEVKGVENLIAGAWGCGVFMQDPSTVATLPAILEFSWRFARRDLNMSPGKLAAQVSHSMMLVEQS